MVAWLIRTGPWGAGLRPFGRGLTLARVKAAPHGIDLGPLEPCLPGRLYTPGCRIDAAPVRLRQDLERARRALEAPKDEQGASLLLVGRRDVRSNNSWMHNSARLVKGRERCTLQMHPADASARGLAHGQRVRVTSRAGSVEVPLEVTADMRPGVVSLPHGWGHHREGTRLRVASVRPGVSLNDLTDEQRVDPLTGNASFSGVPVDVRA
jgi:anaerobic selenocysteine-containing dehydrogenase